MTADASTLLERLGSGISPARPAGRSPGTALEGTSFDDLLRRASEGEIASGLPVHVHRNADVELSEAQLERLAVAADRARAAGAQTALVLMDGMALKLDVGARSVTGRAELGDLSVVTGIDAVVRVPREGEVRVEAPPAPPSGISNASLLRALGGSRTDVA